MSVPVDAESVGIFTHAITSPVDESYRSISCASLVVPSFAVNMISVPSLSVALIKSESITDTSTGKLDVNCVVANTGVFYVFH